MKDKIKLLNLKDMLDSINSGYSFVFSDIRKIRINQANENVNEYAFYIPTNSDEELLKSVGRALRYLELAALDTENVKDLIFRGEILYLEKLLSLPSVKDYGNLDKLFSENVLLIRNPIELSYDKDNKIVLYYSFGYKKHERTPSIANSTSR